MANTLTATAEGMALDWMFIPGASPTRPSTYYLSLHVGANGGAGANNEVSTSGTSYARQATTWSRTGNVISNTGVVVFGPFTSAIGTVTDCCVWTASTGGTCLAQGANSISILYGNGDSATIAIGGQTLSLT